MAAARRPARSASPGTVAPSRSLFCPTDAANPALARDQAGKVVRAAAGPAGQLRAGGLPLPVRTLARTIPAGATIHRVELLRTERLLLRHWSESDLAAFFDLYSREDVVRWLGPHPRRPLATAREARDRLRRWHAVEQGLAPPLGLWAIVPLIAGAQPGQPVGTVPFLPLSDARGPTGLVEVGWHLHPAHQGRGLATEAARGVLVLAGQAGIDHVLALTDPDNAASQRVAMRLGMQDEGMTERWLGLTCRQFRKVLGSQAGGA